MASTKRKDSVSESFTSESEEWDTDLEDCCQQETRQRQNSSLEETYLEACRELGVPPATSFIKQMMTTKVHHSCFPWPSLNIDIPQILY